MINTFNPTTNMSYACSPKFKGQATHEILKIDNKKQLIRHETAFFRDYYTIKKSIDYLKNTFSNNANRQIIVGACSSGEQALSIEMLMKEQQHNILAFDISPQSVKDAKKLTFQINKPKNEQSRIELKNRSIVGYNDEFLAFNSGEQFSANTQKKLKKMFNQTFIEIETIPKKVNYFKMLMEKLRCLITKDIEPEFITKTFKARNPKDIKCKFVEGDIRNLDKLVPKGQAHMVTFSNALYHLITEEGCHGAMRYALPKKETYKIVTNIVKQVNKALTNRGLFILGEQEDKQMTDIKLVSEILKENGFKPLENLKGKYCNIWVKYKDVS